MSEVSVMTDRLPTAHKGKFVKVTCLRRDVKVDGEFKFFFLYNYNLLTFSFTQIKSKIWCGRKSGKR